MKPMTPEEVVVWLRESKERRRRALASLSFEDKVRIVVALQRMADEVRAGAGRPGPRRAWRLPGLARSPR